MAHSKVPVKRLQSSQNPNANIKKHTNDALALTQFKPHQPRIDKCLFSVPTHSTCGPLTQVLPHSLPIYPSISFHLLFPLLFDSCNSCNDRDELGLSGVSAVSACICKYTIESVFYLIPGFSQCVHSPFSLQLLLLMLLAMPEALSSASEVDLPVSSALLSLPFYLLCLLLFSVHMLLCTSAESACYFCSLSWGLVFGAVALSSALLCILVSMAAGKGAKPPW